MLHRMHPIWIWCRIFRMSFLQGLKALFLKRWWTSGPKWIQFVSNDPIACQAAHQSPKKSQRWSGRVEAVGAVGWVATGTSMKVSCLIFNKSWWVEAEAESIGIGAKLDLPPLLVGDLSVMFFFCKLGTAKSSCFFLCLFPSQLIVYKSPPLSWHSSCFVYFTTISDARFAYPLARRFGNPVFSTSNSCIQNGFRCRFLPI